MDDIGHRGRLAPITFGKRDTQNVVRKRELLAAREACEKDVCYYPRCSCFQTKPDYGHLIK